MKVRPVVVWFVEPVRMARGAPPRRILSFEVEVAGRPDAKAMAENLLGSAQHPEDRPEGPTGEIMQGMVSAIMEVQARMQAAPTPGARLLPGWVEFTTAAGEILLVPQERIAWVELGAETEQE